MPKKKKAGKRARARTPRCPGCGGKVNWDRIKIVENEMSVYLRERLYFCPACGVVLGVSSWHQIR